MERPRRVPAPGDRGGFEAAFLLLLGSVGFLLLIACGNVANLLLARAASREREVAVRSALGAGRGRLLKAENAVSVNVELPFAVYSDWNRVAQFFSQFTQGVREEGLVAASGATGFLPFDPGWRIGFGIRGRPPAPDGEQPRTQYVTVTPGYFQAMGIPMQHGRTFTEGDDANSRGVVVINQEMARRFFPDQKPVGQVFISATDGIGPLGRTLMESPEFEIVGVAGDYKNSSLESRVEPAVYFSCLQFPYRNMNVVLKGKADPSQLVSVARRHVERLDPDLALSGITTLDDLFGDSISQPRFFMLLMAGFALLALILAAVGIYGVLSCAVSLRSHEIGIRIALGAAPWGVTGMVVREGFLMAVVGVMLGLAGAWGLSRFVSSLLYGVEVRDLPIFGASLLVILLVALTACYLPARKAAAIDPIRTLRAE